MALLVFGVAFLTRLVMPARRMVVEHAVAAELPPAIENANGQQHAASGPREDFTQTFVHLKPKPRNAQAQQRGQQHMAHARQGRHGQRLRPAPATGARDEDKGQPVRRQRRMKKGHRKSGKSYGRKDRIIHE